MVFGLGEIEIKKKKLLLLCLVSMRIAIPIEWLFLGFMEFSFLNNMSGIVILFYGCFFLFKLFVKL